MWEMSPQKLAGRWFWEIARHDQWSCTSDPGGNTVSLTNASVQLPRKPFDDDRRRIEHCWLKAAKPPWEWGRFPQKTGIWVDFMSLNELVGVTQPFIRLEDLLLPPPLPAMLALLMVFGTLHLGLRGARWLRGSAMSPVEFAAAFVLTTGLLAALVHALAWGGYASVPVLRLGGWALAALGVLELSSWRLERPKRVLCKYFREASLAERCALVLSIVTVIGLVAAALGPATDADSLDYHLGVPLDWLRHGGAYPRPDWFTARYVGLGESLNMLGLAAGTDGLGAAFQAAGLVVALVGVTAFARARADQLFAVLLVVACPVIATLITAQKPQLLPAAALTIAVVILVQRFKRFDPPTALLAFGCAAFAMASKHSFLLTGSVVVVIGLVVAVRAQRLRLALVALTGCVAVLAVPVFARNFVFYGDPISPLLERWRPGGDPVLIVFAQHLRAEGGPVTLRRIARLPWDLAVSLNPRYLYEVLGIGVFGFLLALRERGPTRPLLLAALAAFVLIVASSPLKPRYFLEPYLWCAAAAVAVPSCLFKSLFFKALTVQAVLVAGGAVYLGVVLFPGALTQTGRERVMTLMAPGYAEAKWLDATLPPDAVVLEEFRYRALLPRPFIVGEKPSFALRDQFLAFVGDRFLLTDVPNWKQQLTEFLKEKRVTVLVTQYPIESPPSLWLTTRYGIPLAGPAKFRNVARSPFNRDGLTGWIATRLIVDVPAAQLDPR